jgi:hypothetical protein
VKAGERITLKALTGLKFVPASAAVDQTSILSYSVQNPVSTASGNIAITTGPF